MLYLTVCSCSLRVPHPVVAVKTMLESSVKVTTPSVLIICSSLSVDKTSVKWIKIYTCMLYCMRCLHYVVTSIFCPADSSTLYSNCTTGDIRLVPGTTHFTGPENSTVQGRLEVCINHAWGSVCGDEFFDSWDAAVACRQLGGLTYEGLKFTTLCTHVYSEHILLD